MAVAKYIAFATFIIMAVSMAPLLSLLPEVLEHSTVVVWNMMGVVISVW